MIGNEISIPFDDEGKLYCPICGSSQNGYAPYAVDGIPSDEICPGCGTQFGSDDVPPISSQPMPIELYFRTRRILWLSQIGWTESALEQLRTNLGIDTEALKREAGRTG